MTVKSTSAESPLVKPIVRGFELKVNLLFSSSADLKPIFIASSPASVKPVTFAVTVNSAPVFSMVFLKQPKPGAYNSSYDSGYFMIATFLMSRNMLIFWIRLESGLKFVSPTEA